MVYAKYRHGGPYDRGSADAYYGRPRDPHYFVGDTNNSREVRPPEMTKAQVRSYNKGYNEEPDRKYYGAD